MKPRMYLLLVLAALLLLPLLAPVSARAATVPPLGTAATFAVLASSAVTNTGPTTVIGDLGVSAGSDATGFPPGVVNGTIHNNDGVAISAESSATTAYNNARGQPCDVNLTGQDLGGKTLTPGVYCFSSSAQLTGQLVLDAQGNPSSVFIFQIGSTLTTASNASVVLINGVQPCSSNIFWQVGSSATLGTNTSFTGNILALASITLNTGSVTNGGLYALTGAVTLDSNNVVRNNQVCNTVSTVTPVSSATGTTTATTTATGTATPTTTATSTATPSGTATGPATPTSTTTSTAMPTSTTTSTATPTSTATSTATLTATATLTVPVRSADTATPTAAKTVGPTGAATRAAVMTVRPTATATRAAVRSMMPTATPTVRATPQTRYHDVTQIHTTVKTIVRYHDVTRTHTTVKTIVRYHDVTRTRTTVKTIVRYRTVERVTTITRVKHLTTIRVVVNHKTVYIPKTRYVTVVHHITKVVIHHKTGVSTRVTYHYYHQPRTGRFAGPSLAWQGATPPVEARFSITRLGISWAPVWARDYQTNADGLLSYDIVPAYGVTRFSSSAGFGQPGLTLMSGHDDIAGNILRYLGEMRRGDVIQIWRGRHTFRYVVTSIQVVTPDNVSLLNAPQIRPTLALVSCTPYWVDTSRVVVIAEMQ